MFKIEDLSLLKITKIKPWAILFDYDNKHYFLHGKNEEYDEYRNYMKEVWTRMGIILLNL